MTRAEFRSQEPEAGMQPGVASAPGKGRSAWTWMGILTVMAGLTVLAGCGGGNGGGGSTTTGSPAVTLSAGSLTFTSGVGVQSAAQSVTVTNSGTAQLSFTSIGITPSTFAETNNCGTGISAGTTCSISVTFTPSAAGAASGTLTIADNASNSPQTVSLTGTGTSVSVSTGSLNFSSSNTQQSVTLNNSGSSAASITSIGITAGSSNFSETNNCGSSVAANSSCTINVTFTPPASGSVSGTLTIVDAEGTQTVSLSGAAAGSNSASISVNFGPNGFSTPANSYYNGVFTTVAVCQPTAGNVNVTQCVNIPNVLVDTGSVGLRVFSNQLGSLSLPQVKGVSGNDLYECVEYGDLSYTFGPVQMASVQIGGESAFTTPSGTTGAGIPIQVITNGGSFPYQVGCTSGGGGSDSTVSALGANGILGVGNYPQDCGETCSGSPTDTASSPWPYFYCNTNLTTCNYDSATLQEQVWNPVAAFTGSDTNGVMIDLPSAGASGSSSVTGTMYFGINTQSNNQMTTQTAYELDDYGDFGQATYDGVNYTSLTSGGAFIDSGSNALYILDAGLLTTDAGVTVNNCTDNGYYCPNSTINLSITLQGSTGNSVAGNGNISIANADTLFSGNENAAFSNLGGASCVASTGSPCSASTDFLDFGLPFFFGHPIFVGIAGSTVQNLPFSNANGFWAF